MKFWKAALIFLFLVLPSNVYSSSVYYTFEGFIDNFGNDRSGEASNAGLSYGSTVVYTVEIDFSKDASQTRPDDTIEYLVDTTGYYYGWYSVDYFYCSLLNSSHPLLSAFIPYNLSNDYIDNNKGASITTSYTYTINGVSYVGYNNSGELTLADNLFLQDQHKHVQDWVVGENIQGYYSYGDVSGNLSNTFRTNLTLTNISTVPTPLPSSIWLLGASLVGLAAITRNKRTQQFTAREPKKRAP